MTDLHTAAAGPGPDCRPADKPCWHPCFNLECQYMQQQTGGFLSGEPGVVTETHLSCACPMRPVRELRGWLKRLGITDPLAALETVRQSGKVGDNAEQTRIGAERKAAIDRYFATVSDEEFLADLKAAGFKLTPINPVAQVGDKDLRDSPIIWGDWDDSGPYLVLAEGRTIAEAAQVVDEATCASDGGVRAVPLDGPQPRRATVHDCEHDEIGRCKDPQCRHGHEETVYVFELVDEDEISFTHYWTLSRYTSPSGKLMYHCPTCGLYDPAPVKTQYERRPCMPGAYEGRWAVADGVVRVVLNPDTQTAGIPDKPHVWRLHGADNMRYAPELVKTVNEAMREGER